jgi:predicted ATPase
MITSIRIQNFKSFRDTGEIALKPITILIGTNSSGKSSILQSLLAIRQTVDSRDTEVPLLVVGDYVDLGSYADCVFRHQTAEKDQTFLSFGYAIVVGSDLRKRYFGSPTQSAIESKIDFNSFNLSTTYAYNRKARRIYLRRFQVYDGKSRLVLDVSSNAVGQVLEVSSQVLSFDFSSKAVVKTFAKNLRRRKFIYEYVQKLRLPLVGSRDKSFAEERQFSHFLSNCYDLTEREFSRVFYLGPLRRKTLRINAITGETPQDVGFDGENVLKVLYKDYKASKSQSKGLIPRVKTWLRKFNVAVDLEVVSLSANHFALNVVDSHNKVKVNLSDVGFGVSQILPVIVEGFYSPRGSMMMVEQPEIHLHPALQSDLGDLLIEISKDNKTVVVETHSEHLLLRIQKRIAEGALDPNEVAIYFVKPGEDGSIVERISLNNYGQFMNWPSGFFEEDIQEGIDHIKAISKKLEGVGRPDSQ